MVTLAFSQMVYFVFHDTKLGGGSDGTYLYAKPKAMLGGWSLLDFDATASSSTTQCSGC
jgi:branched-chain amino acid transport system permease protein